jgi:outer membrane protein OmpA-like peptidoglycan-associated protein
MRLEPGWSAELAILLVVTTVTSRAHAQNPLLPLPPVAGVSLVQTLTTDPGDRESVHTVTEATAKALRWTWQLVEVQENNDTVRSEFRYAELHADIRDAIRFRAYHDVEGPEEHPGYTMHAISSAVYGRLRAAGSDTFQVMAVESPAGGALPAVGFARRATPVRWSGTLSVVTPSPEKFPLILNGKRVDVPALHLRGRFSMRSKVWEPELWVLADSAYPMLLKWVGSHTQRSNVLQTVRVDVPSALPEFERGLTSACRAELPGIYFAFNSAVLDVASDRTIASVAAILARHPDWKVTLEGHTDSIGSATANQALSERRVAAVTARLVSQHKVSATRVTTVGLGSAKPRETNASIEGRARNRRVELVRDCTRR